MDSQKTVVDEKYTYVIEHVSHLPSKRSYDSLEECARAGLSFGQAKFGEKLVDVKVMQDGKIIASWQQ